MQSGRERGPSTRERHNLENWERAFEGLETVTKPAAEQQTLNIIESVEEPTVVSSAMDAPETEAPAQPTAKPLGIAFQLHGKYIVTSIRSGLLVIHQQRAHERILFDRFVHSMEQQAGASQQQLFPKTIELPAQDAALVTELLEDLRGLGFGIREFGQHAFILEGLPADCADNDPASLLESVLESFKISSADARLSQREALARSMAATAAVKVGKAMQPEEMNHLVDQLFACEMPYVSPSGKPTINTLTLEDLDNQFKA